MWIFLACSICNTHTVNMGTLYLLGFLGFRQQQQQLWLIQGKRGRREGDRSMEREGRRKGEGERKRDCVV